MEVAFRTGIAFVERSHTAVLHLAGFGSINRDKHRSIPRCEGSTTSLETIAVSHCHYWLRRTLTADHAVRRRQPAAPSARRPSRLFGRSAAATEHDHVRTAAGSGPSRNSA
jgi:hypothetical protein